MKRFAELFTQLDQTTKTNQKVDALVKYFREAPAQDVVWSIALLADRKPKRTVKSGELRAWSAELSGLPDWIYDESYHVVGDLAETITLVLPEAKALVEHSLTETILLLISFATFNDEQRKAAVQNLWMEMDTPERFVFNKLITGSFRIGVSQQLVVKALAKQYEIPENIIAHRLMGDWDPQHVTLEKLFLEDGDNDDLSKPYPFYLAYQLDVSLQDLGNLEEWIIERKYDGIRGQLIVRNKELFVWSRGEELMTDKFPEFESLRDWLPTGTVIDGEVLPFKDDKPMPFHVMQTRIGRKNLTKKAQSEAPLAMMCYDLLEFEGMDLRSLSMQLRREKLEALLGRLYEKHPETKRILRLSPVFACKTEEEIIALRLESRDFQCEGLMLKHKDSPYETGRRRGKWWKWKIDPLSVDGVLLYAQRGHGRRADLYTDYTFAVWDGDELVPFAKAYSGLTDKELLQVDAWVKRHTLEKFGPVRSVTPELVFEIAFEGINPSPRHKSGVALRFPRILRWRTDKNIKDANTKQDLLELIDQLNGTHES